jgi:hypothetical protein
LHTLKELEAWRVSVIAMNGLAFDLSTPHGRMMATIKKASNSSDGLNWAPKMRRLAKVEPCL